MQQLQMYQKYLLPLAVLLLLKFVLVPLWDAKEENYLQLNSSQYNLEKTRALAGLGEPMQQRKTQMAELVAKAEMAVVSGSSLTQVKLDAQSAIDSQLREQKLNLTNSNWVDGLGEADITTLFYEFSFSGGLPSYLMFLQQFSSNTTFAGMSLESSRLRISNRAAPEPAQIDATLSIRLPVRLENAK